MTSTQLPPLNFGGAGLRLSLFAPSAPDRYEATKKPLVEEKTTEEAPVHSEEETVPSDSETEEPTLPTKEETSESVHELEQPIVETTRSPPPQNIPVHPIPSLQDAFAESLNEATNGPLGDKPKLRALDAQGRRETLVSQDRDAEPFDASWRFRPGQKNHELVKLISQISFGVYLLLNGLANSNAQVISILQGHIDEVDEFLEVALEDLAQATDDVNGRIEHLKMPLANVEVFEQLLEDRNFRLEILEGNEKIDHVLARTNAALKQWDEDIDAGLHSTAAFTGWLHDEEDATWRQDRPDLVEIFDAMKGNTEGWLSAFDDMSDRVQEAGNVIMSLSTIMAEMEKKAGEVSRRTWANIQPFTIPFVSSESATPASPKSGTSSRHSQRKPSHRHQPSVQSGAASTTKSVSTSFLDLEEDFPLPGGLPLLPPQRSGPRRPSAGGRIVSHKPPSKPPIQPAPEPKVESKLQRAASRSPSASEEPLYVLQPRTYTPQSREPSPAPLSTPAATPRPDSRKSVQPQDNPLGINPIGSNGQGMPKKRTSIRHRVSQRTKPPEAIQIPSISEPGLSPAFATPRTAQSNPFDSAYGSDSESITHARVPTGDRELGGSPPTRPQVARSPRSDHQQYYRPVRASPHSPLQQRPHTAVGSRASQSHLRNQPSALGGMSTLSNVTNAVYDDDTKTVASRAGTTGPKLRKKKSAFGWFKKAFSMDEEEKAAFEARKAMQHNNRYYDPNSPKFLDGRRIK